MNTAQNLKQALKKSAKTFSDEPLEILKNMARQVSPEMPPSQNNFDQNQEKKVTEDAAKKMMEMGGGLSGLLGNLGK